jgi:hypothetical protein
MVHIKFTSRPRTSIVSPKFASMALDNAPEVSTEQREISFEQPKDSLVNQWMIASTESTSEQGAESNWVSQSSGSSNDETASDEGEHVKVGAATALAGISYDFSPSTLTRIRIGSLESYEGFFRRDTIGLLVVNLF